MKNPENDFDEDETLHGYIELPKDVEFNPLFEDVNLLELDEDQFDEEEIKYTKRKSLRDYLDSLDTDLD